MGGDERTVVWCGSLDCERAEDGKGMTITGGNCRVLMYEMWLELGWGCCILYLSLELRL